MLTKELALQITEELWTWLAEEDGGQKSDWPGWKKYGWMDHNCPLCEYTGIDNRREGCARCPYHKKFGACQSDDSPYNDWWYKGGQKVHAQAFLEQIKSLR